jgi:hypothetical protein
MGNLNQNTITFIRGCICLFGAPRSTKKNGTREGAEFEF